MVRVGVLFGFLLFAIIGCGPGRPTAPPEHAEPVEAWIKKLRDPKESPAVRSEAIQVLGIKGAGSPDAVAAVAEALNDKGSLVRHSAVMALQKMKAKSALPHLKKSALDDADVNVRQAAAAAVAALEAMP